MSDHESGDRFGDSVEDEELRHLFDAAGPRIVVPEHALEKLRQVSRQRWLAKTRWRRRRPLVLSGLTAAAAALLAVALIGLLGSRNDRPVTLASLVAVSGGDLLSTAQPDEGALPLGAPLSAGDRLRTSEGRASLELAAGGSLRLDRETRLRLLGPAVVELEEGTVYFDSAGRGAEGPALELRTPLGSVFEVGTRFETRVEEGGLRVRVRDGEVRVDRAEGSASAVAGEALRISPSGTVSRTAVEPWDRTFDWIHDAAPAFEIEGRSLEAFLAWVAREGGFTLSLGDEAQRAATETVLHGSIDGLDPRAALEIVLPSAGLSHALEKGELTVRVEAPR